MLKDGEVRHEGLAVRCPQCRQLRLDSVSGRHVRHDEDAEVLPKTSRQHRRQRPVRHLDKLRHDAVQVLSQGTICSA